MKYPTDRHPAFFYATVAASFIISLSLYILTLAPTVTFEDSGELIAAAYNLGIPHQPGYPLFTLLGRVFSMLPIDTVAYRLNLMSAVLSAAGAMFLTWALILLIEDAFKKRNAAAASGKKKSAKTAKRPAIFPTAPILKYAAALAGGILTATAFENWEQSIITEVYGLNTMFVGLIVLLAAQWKRAEDDSRRGAWFLAICYVLGLTLCNHTTSLMFIPILFVFGFLEDRHFILNPKMLLSGFAALMAGLTPYLYLPVASARNPLMDWGNPENLTNFIRTVSRHQYGLGDQQTLAKFIPQLQTYFQLLSEQWAPTFLLFPILGLYALWRHQRNWCYFTIVFFLFAGPITTFMTDFDVTVRDPFVAAEHRALVSVFYIPSYMCLALLAGAGLYWGAAQLVARLKLHEGAAANTLAALIVLLPIMLSYANFKKVDMSDYYFAEDYVHNVFEIAPENSVVFANWDPFYFPFNYYQFVQDERLDVIAIDQQLLRRSWYIDWMRNHYPEFMKMAEAEVDAFLKAVEPFENKQPFNGNVIQRHYIAMINAIIDRSIEAGREVLFTYNTPRDIAVSYRKESLISAVRLASSAERSQVDFNQFSFRNFFDENRELDRMALVFKNYYGGLIFSRARLEAARGDRDTAINLFNETARFMADNPGYLQQIDTALKALQNESRNESNQ